MPPFTTVQLEGDRRAALASLPVKAGVGQIVGQGGRNLLIGRPANLRKWAMNNLGLGRPVAKGQRPPTDLSSIATGVAFAEATSAFHQRLLFERLMERHVPREKRRDLKPPAFLRLDPSERFPRLVVLEADADLSRAFGPFRDRRAAARAREALQKAFRLRPCDYEFEPHPELPLGLGCLFAQVRSCAAPCLVRASEAEYRDLAVRAADTLGGAGPRPDELAEVLPPFVAQAGSRGLVVASNRGGVELYPVQGGGVCELDRVDIPWPTESLEAALSGLRFEPRASGSDDYPWLLSWLQAPRRGGNYLVWSPGEPPGAFAARVREVLT